MFHQYEFESSEADKDRVMSESKRNSHIYDPKIDDDIIRTTISSWKKKKDKSTHKNYVNEYKDPVENFKQWYLCKGKRESNQKLGYLLSLWLTEKEIQVNCKKKDGKCELGKANGINKAYKTCKK